MKSSNRRSSLGNRAQWGSIYETVHTLTVEGEVSPYRVSNRMKAIQRSQHPEKGVFNPSIISSYLSQRGKKAIRTDLVGVFFLGATTEDHIHPLQVTAMLDKAFSVSPSNSTVALTMDDLLSRLLSSVGFNGSDLSLDEETLDSFVTRINVVATNALPLTKSIWRNLFNQRPLNLYELTLFGGIVADLGLVAVPIPQKDLRRIHARWSNQHNL